MVNLQFLTWLESEMWWKFCLVSETLLNMFIPFRNGDSWSRSGFATLANDSAREY